MASQKASLVGLDAIGKFERALGPLRIQVWEPRPFAQLAQRLGTVADIGLGDLSTRRRAQGKVRRAPSSKLIGCALNRQRLKLSRKRSGVLLAAPGT